MQNKTLHIISLTIPYPANYGGVIDIWHKMKALNSQGVNIIMHCFAYNRKPSEQISKFCSKVYYYPRKKQVWDLISATPFIIKSRENNALIKNLLKDDHPILMEGIHCMGILKNAKIRNRQLWLRTHNVESFYLDSLRRTEKNWFKNFYFDLESKKLEKFESQKLPVSGIFTISDKDDAFFRSFNPKTILVTPFHGHESVTASCGKGDFLLYHADLSVSENNQNAIFLARISNKFPLPLIIAGRMPGASLKLKIAGSKNVSLLENVSEKKMENLIKKAAIILLPARQTTGFRLKLLDSLFWGRHIIASPHMLEGTGLRSACHIASHPQEWIALIKKLSTLPFSEVERKKRIQLLHPFSDNMNAEKIISAIFKQPGD